jgi:rubredoxin
VSNYPPGVTGGEYQIAGADREVEEQVECPECGLDAIQLVSYYGYERWWTCTVCRSEITESDEDQWRFQG